MRKTLATEFAKTGVPIRVAMELMRHSDSKLTTQVYTDAGMLPIWDAVGTLPMFNDTQKLFETSQSASARVRLDPGKERSLGVGEEKLRPLATSTVPQSSEQKVRAPCRNRTCNPVIKSHLLCQLS